MKEEISIQDYISALVRLYDLFERKESGDPTIQAQRESVILTINAFEHMIREQGNAALVDIRHELVRGRRIERAAEMILFNWRGFEKMWSLPDLREALDRSKDAG